MFCFTSHMGNFALFFYMGYVPLLKKKICPDFSTHWFVVSKCLLSIHNYVIYLQTRGIFPPCIWTIMSLYRSFCNMSTDSVYCCFTWPGFLCLRSYRFILSLLLTLFYQFISQLSLRVGLFTLRFKTRTQYLYYLFNMIFWRTTDSVVNTFS